MTRPTRGRTALVTGVAGQDGVYLADLLLRRGYTVIGTVRPGAADPRRAVYLDGVRVVELDQRDREGFARLLEEIRPEEIYNLAGLTSVAASWKQAELVAETNAMAVLRMLESLRDFRERHGSAPRFLQPSSSEMFGVSDQQPQTESTPHHPRSPYAASKSFAHHLTVNYRESYGLFASTATLYNHESPLRSTQFVTRKITRGVAEIALGRSDHLSLGNLDVYRDWGFAGDYVRAMHGMLQLDTPSDFIVATGESRSLHDLLTLAFRAVGIDDVERHVRQDPAFMRPADVSVLYGDVTKAREELGWSPSLEFADVVAHMVRTDIERLRSGVEHSPAYLYPAAEAEVTAHGVGAPA